MVVFDDDFIAFLWYLFGMVDDKTIDSVLKLLPKNAFYYFTKASVPRALDEELLLEYANIYKLTGRSYDSVNDAIIAAQKNSDKNDMIYIGGSTFIVADALKYFYK